jgi:hypothetical protein
MEYAMHAVSLQVIITPHSAFLTNEALGTASISQPHKHLTLNNLPTDASQHCHYRTHLPS